MNIVENLSLFNMVQNKEFTIIIIDPKFNPFSEFINKIMMQNSAYWSKINSSISFLLGEIFAISETPFFRDNINNAYAFSVADKINRAIIIVYLQNTLGCFLLLLFGALVMSSTYEGEF